MAKLEHVPCTPSSSAATFSSWIRAKGLPARKLIAEGIPTLTVNKKARTKKCVLYHVLQVSGSSSDRF